MPPYILLPATEIVIGPLKPCSVEDIFLRLLTILTWQTLLFVLRRCALTFWRKDYRWMSKLCNLGFWTQAMFSWRHYSQAIHNIGVADSALCAEKVHVNILAKGFSLNVKTLLLRILNSEVGFSLNVNCPLDSTSLSASADRSATLSSNDASSLENDFKQRL